MVVLDLDHPDIEEFVNWKVVEEQKVAALVAGSQLLNRHLNADPQGVPRLAATPSETLRPRRNNADLRKAIAEARAGADARRTTSSACSSSPSRAFTSLHVEEYDTDWNSKAYFTVSGQNSNNSVRITNAFMEAVEQDGAVAPLLAHREGEGREGGPRAEAEEDAEGPRPVGRRSPTPPGPAPTPACSSTPPSTSGTPARPTAGSTRSNPCSRVHVPR